MLPHERPTNEYCGRSRCDWYWRDDDVRNDKGRIEHAALVLLESRAMRQPFGTQPPWLQMPPPMAVNGSGLVQVPSVVDVDVLVVPGTHPPFTQTAPGNGAVPGQPVDDVVVPPLDVPPGTQPPFTHTAPGNGGLG